MGRHSPPERQQGVLYSFFFLMALAVFAYTTPAGAKPGQGKGPPDKGNDTGYQKEQRILWSLPLKASFSQVRPEVASDGSGTIYAVDASGNLYIVTADGVLSRVVRNAGSKGVDLASDGTVYTGNEDRIRAFTPTGDEKWTYNLTPRAFVLSDVAVGPDDNIYAIASNGIGVFSLEDGGDEAFERWRTNEQYDRTNALYSEVAFGRSNNPADGEDPNQLYFRINQDTRGLKSSSGHGVFKLQLGQVRPVVSPFDQTIHFPGHARHPDGSLFWEFTDFPAGTASTTPALGSDGTHYTVNQGRRIFAINPRGRELWRVEAAERLGPPDIDPGNNQLIMATEVTSTRPAALKAVNANNGGDLWRIELPLITDPDVIGRQFIDTQLGFDPISNTAYVITGVAGGHATLHAISLDPGIPQASSILRISTVTLEARTRRREQTITGEVAIVDQNREPISGATVMATWTLPDGSTLDEETVSGSRGIATFSVAAGDGIYRLSVNGVVKGEYVYDPEHSRTNGSLFAF